eukprot:scaffold30485_cov24-Tisochrysis_lutea.AAC.3
MQVGGFEGGSVGSGGRGGRDSRVSDSVPAIVARTAANLLRATLALELERRERLTVDAAIDARAIHAEQAASADRGRVNF